MKQSPLHDAHKAAGAKLVPFAGWEMPVSFAAGTIAEHKATRAAAGIFDVSHLGSVRVRGSGAFDLLNSSFTNDLGRISPGKAQYTLILNHAGGVVDDVIIWWTGAEEFWVIPNASNTQQVVDALTGDGHTEVEIDDATKDFAIIAVQGPLYGSILKMAGLGELSAPRFAVVEFEGVVAAGTGYTGEPGCELMVTASDAPEIWDQLVDAAESYGGGAAGLGARDTLRLEMGYPLHGNEMDDQVNPYEAALGWVVAMNKGEFLGRSALEKVGPGAKRELVGMEMLGREIPRAGCAVRAGGSEIGIVTSGNFSPVLEHGVALARVERGSVIPGSPLEVEIRGRVAKAICVSPPFVDR